MATSRDDFVIAIRSAFLKKGNQQRFSLIVLIFFSILLIFLSRLNYTAINYLKTGVNEVIYRVSFVASIPEQQLEKSINLINQHFYMYEEYEDIKKKIKKLESNKLSTSFVVNENKRLRKLIDEYITTSDELVAKVLLDKDSPFLKSIIVNKGSKDNVQMGMAVLDENYLVGKIVEVNYSTSRALLISDLNSKIPVIIEPGGVNAILSGNGNDNHADLEYLPVENSIEEGHIVYTSGIDGAISAGLPIGKVFVTKDKKLVRFFADFNQIEFVKVDIKKWKHLIKIYLENLFDLPL